MYGPVRTVVWQGSAGDRRPYADQTAIWEVAIAGRNFSRTGPAHVNEASTVGRISANWMGQTGPRRRRRIPLPLFGQTDHAFLADLPPLARLSRVDSRARID